MSFLAELRRRNVIRVAGLYLVGAWLVVQIAETLLPIFETPGWVLKALVVLLALGFIPALAFAWVFEMTPEGLKREREVDRSQSVVDQTARKLDVAVIVLLLAVGGLVLWQNQSAPSGPETVSGSLSPAVSAEDQTSAAGKSEPDTVSAADTVTGKSIAVLPFADFSPGGDQAWFADGLSEEILNALARTLGVQHVLEGSVRRQGQRVRITAQLIRAGTDAHLWSQTYDRDLTDIFAVQEEIAQAISNELAALLPVASKVAVAASTADIEAYERFLRGRSRFYQRRELVEGLADLEFAVARDPDLAEAWVFLAATRYVAPGYIASADDAGASPATLEALQMARKLAPEHPMVMALDGVLLSDDGDFEAGIDKLAQAAALRSTDTTPVMWHGLMLLQVGYIGQALPVLERAARTDPLSGINNGYLGITRLAAGDAAGGAEATRRGGELGWLAGTLVHSVDLAARGERQRAREILDAAPASNDPEFARIIAAYSRALVDPGAMDAYLALTAEGDGEFSLGIGQQDRLLDQWLVVARSGDLQRRETRWTLRSMWLPSTRTAREDPRFFEIARAFGMVKLWQARGWPDGCTKANDPERLVCTGAPSEP